jgi:ATP-binding protein involved in chromosome partitioning
MVSGFRPVCLRVSVNFVGAVIVSTPQDIALADAIKGINLFKKVNVPVIFYLVIIYVMVCSRIIDIGNGTEYERIYLP